MNSRTRHSALLLLAIVVGLAVIGARAAHGGSTGASFVNFEVAGTPPNPAGTVCPGSAQCFNGAAEPAIRSTPDGRFYGSSENGVGSGTLAWRSTDNGLHYTSLLSPNDISAASTSTGKEASLEPGGGDTDVATATAKNAAGFYNVYVASLTAANIDVSTSADGGASWRLNPATALPIDDREWAAATGASKVCISYLTAPGILLPEAGLHVQCSNDAGTTFVQTGDAYDTSPTGAGCRTASRSGNLTFDPSNGQYLYAIAACQATADATNTNPTANHIVVVATSADGGKTFADHVVYANPDVTASYDNQFPNVTVDKGGNVYAVYSDDHFTYYSFSTDHGTTWHGPYQVSKTGTAIFPWATAGDAGKLDVVYYKTPYYAPGGPGAYPSTAAWTVGFAQNLNAATAGSSFTETTATPVVHFGGVCQGGVGCTGNRDLYDDFGVAASPTTGLASIIYSDDQYTNDANDPPQPGCTAATSNSGKCDHTSIATQTAGPGIYSTKHR